MFEIPMGVVVAMPILYIIVNIRMLASYDDGFQQVGLGMLIAPSVVLGSLAVVGFVREDPHLIRFGILGLGCSLLAVLFIVAISLTVTEAIRGFLTMRRIRARKSRRSR